MDHFLLLDRRDGQIGNLLFHMTQHGPKFTEILVSVDHEQFSTFRYLSQSIWAVVVRKPIGANPELKVNRGFYFSCLKTFSKKM